MVPFYAVVSVLGWYGLTYVNGQAVQNGTASTTTISSPTAVYTGPLVTIGMPYGPQNDNFVGSLIGTEASSTSMIIACAPSVPTFECDFPTGATITQAPSVHIMTYSFAPPGQYIIELTCTSASGGADCVTVTKAERYWFASTSIDEASATDIVSSTESEFVSATDIPLVTVTLTGGVSGSISTGTSTDTSTATLGGISNSTPAGNVITSSTPPPSSAQHINPNGLAAGFIGLAAILLCNGSPS